MWRWVRDLPKRLMQSYFVGGQSQFEKLELFFFFHPTDRPWQKTWLCWIMGTLRARVFFFFYGSSSQEFLIPTAHLGILLFENVLQMKIQIQLAPISRWTSLADLAGIAIMHKPQCGPISVSSDRHFIVFKWIKTLCNIIIICLQLKPWETV